MEAKLTTAPPPAARGAGTVAAMVLRVPSTFTSKMRRYAALSKSASLVGG